MMPIQQNFCLEKFLIQKEELLKLYKGSFINHEDIEVGCTKINITKKYDTFLFIKMFLKRRLVENVK